MLCCKYQTDIIWHGGNGWQMLPSLFIWLQKNGLVPAPFCKLLFLMHSCLWRMHLSLLIASDFCREECLCGLLDPVRTVGKDVQGMFLCLPSVWLYFLQLHKFESWCSVTYSPVINQEPTCSCERNTISTQLCRGAWIWRKLTHRHVYSPKQKWSEVKTNMKPCSHHAAFSTQITVSRLSDKHRNNIQHRSRTGEKVRRIKRRS